MQRKVQGVLDELVSIISSWDCVDTICVSENAEEDMYDPYFFLSLDVYYRGELPDPDTRSEAIPGGGAYESSLVQTKDRLIINDIPVRIEYKDISRIDGILNNQKDLLWVFRNTGTYMFYRIETASVLHRKSDWIDGIKQKLLQLPEIFWNTLAESFEYRMEHYLSDLSSAVMKDDPYFTLTSSAGFIQTACSCLFAINRRFEPSGRAVFTRVLELPELPENFRGHFESFLRPDNELLTQKKRQLADLITRGIVSLYEVR